MKASDCDSGLYLARDKFDGKLTVIELEVTQSGMFAGWREWKMLGCELGAGDESIEKGYTIIRKIETTEAD